MALIQNYMLTDSGKNPVKYNYTPPKQTNTNVEDTPPRTTGSGKSSSTPSAPKVKAVEPSVTQEKDETRDLYDQALETLSAAEQGRPEWNGSAYDADIDSLYAQISGRGEYSYRLNEDALWQQLKDQYMQAGKTAMQDTMGQAAALTGGYGSSYGQAVGQQAYDRQTEKLMEIAPELEERAYQRYQDEGDALLDRLGLARGLASDEYGKWKDEYGIWADERGYARDVADDAYEKWLYEREYEDAATAKNYSKLLSYIQLGYTPTDQELADAGITPEQFKTLWNAYAPKEKSSGGSKSSGSSSTSGSGGDKGATKERKPYMGLDKDTFTKYRKEWLSGLGVK